MTDVRLVYERVNGWLRNRSRVGFAAVVGAGSALTLLAFGALVGERMLFDAITMGVAMTAAYYFFDPQDKG